MGQIIDLDNFSPDEQIILRLVIDGMILGRKEYGPLVLEHDDRDFGHEALHELRDALFYLTCLLAKFLRRENYGKIESIG